MTSDAMKHPRPPVHVNVAKPSLRRSNLASEEGLNDVSKGSPRKERRPSDGRQVAAHAHPKRRPLKSYGSESGFEKNSELFPRAGLWHWDNERLAEMERQFEAQGMFAVSNERSGQDKKSSQEIRQRLRSRHMKILKKAELEKVERQEKEARERELMETRNGEPALTVPDRSISQVKGNDLVIANNGKGVELSSKYVQERLKDPVFKAFFDVCIRHKLLPESKMQLKHTAGGCLNLAFYGMGDQYLESIAAGFKIAENDELKTLCLRACRLSNAGVKRLLSSLEEGALSIFRLDVSCNDIALPGITDLGEFLTQKSCCLAELNLDNNSLGDRSIIRLCSYLSKGSTVRKLLLNENNIAGKGTLAIARMLSYESKCRIRQLELGWNQITGPPAKKLLQSLQGNFYLESLVIDWNNFSAIDGFSDEFNAFLESGSALQRLAIAHNGLQEQTTRAMLESIFQADNVNGENETNQPTTCKPTCLLSLDLTGNVIPDEYGPKGCTIQKGLLLEEWPKRGIFDPKIIYSRYGSAQDEREHLVDSTVWKLRSDCWIADGWKERTISYFPGISGPPADTLAISCTLPNGVRYHCKMEAFPEQQQLQDRKQSTESQVSVSSNFQNYNYNSNNSLPESFALNDKDKPFHPFKVSVLLPPGNTTVEFFVDGQRQVALDMPTVHKATMRRKMALLNYIEIDARSAGLTTLPSQSATPKWAASESLFGSQREFTRESLARSFESDWEVLESKNYLMKDLVATNEYSAIRTLLWTHYQDIVTAFNFRASLGDNVFAMDILELRRWFNEARVIPEDFNYEIFEKIYDQAAFFQNRVAKDLVGKHYQYFVIARGKKRARRKGGLCRHQFLQFILSYTFEMLTTVRRRPFCGLRMLLSKLLDKEKVNLSHRETFRKEHLLHEEVCTPLQENLPVLQRIFDKHAVRGHVSKSFFTLATWNRIVLMLDKEYGSMPLTLMFVMSKDTLIPISHEDFTPGLDFLEFVECLARLAHADNTAHDVIGAMKSKTSDFGGKTLAQQTLDLATKLDKLSRPLA